MPDAKAFSPRRARYCARPGAVLRRLAIPLFFAISAAAPAEAAVVLPAAPAVSTAALSVIQLVDQANKALRGNASHGRLIMTVRTPDWTRSRDIEVWNLGRRLAFIKILSPAKEKGNVTLRRGNEMWLWMPRVERVIKIPPTMMHSAWEGSDFNYEDIVKADSIVKDYAHRLLGQTAEPGRMVYRVEALPKPEAPVVWGKVILTIAAYAGGAVIPLKEEDYDDRGELIRTLKFSDVKTMGGRLIPARLECDPAKNPGHATVIQYGFLDFQAPLTESFFSLSRLQEGVE